MRFLAAGEHLPADRPLEIPRRSAAVGEGVEVAGAVKRLGQRLLGVAGGLVEIPLSVGDQPGIFVVAVGILRGGLDLVIDLPQGLVDPADRIGPLVGRVVGERVESDQGVDILGIGAEGDFHRLTGGRNFTPGPGGARFKEVHPRSDGALVAPELLQDLVDVEIRAPHGVVEQLPEAGGRLRFPLLLVQKFGSENGSQGKLSRRGAGIVEERRIAGGGPIDAAPPREQDRHLQPVGIVDVGPLVCRAGEGRCGERFGLRQIAPAALGKGGGIAEAGLRAERLRLRRGEMVNEFRQTILNPPHQHLDRLGGIGF